MSRFDLSKELTVSVAALFEEFPKLSSQASTPFSTGACIRTDYRHIQTSDDRPLAMGSVIFGCCAGVAYQHRADGWSLRLRRGYN